MEDDDATILEPYEISFSDLILLSSGNVPSPDSASEETERLQSILKSIMQNLGPKGPGLLTVTGVPNASRLRRKLLPLARKLALLNTDDRKRVLKEHNLGSDVPLKNLDRVVSSFAMQLKYVQDADTKEASRGDCYDKNQYPTRSELSDFQDTEFENLGSNFKELGFCMMDLGIRLARVCDQIIGGNELEQTLLESCTAKGRLIYYHSSLDKNVSSAETRRRSSKPHGSSNLWQQWHYDYGVFTVLTCPMFLSTFGKQECSISRRHTHLQVFVPSEKSVKTVKASPESLIVQLGEAADILSKRKLRANLHSVSRPVEEEDTSRETFVVFLQPAWTKRLSLENETCIHDEQDKGEEVDKIVPLLSSRLRDGMTFAEFARETTKQYYGDNGLQSNRYNRCH